MNRFITAIKAALSTENYYAALLMAITIPDICGNLENPEKKSQERYVEWFNRYMVDKYTVMVGGGSYVFLSGEDCYALRCSFIHEGVDNIMTQRARKALTSFIFVKPGRNIIHRNQCDDKLQLQVDMFCLEICQAVEQWVKEVVNSNQAVQKRCQELLTIHSQEDLSL